MALVTAALVVIGVASTLVLNSYLMDRVDRQLFEHGPYLQRGLIPRRPPSGIVLPSDYLLRVMDAHGVGPEPVMGPALTDD